MFNAGDGILIKDFIFIWCIVAVLQEKYVLARFAYFLQDNLYWEAASYMYCTCIFQVMFRLRCIKCMHGLASYVNLNAYRTHDYTGSYVVYYGIRYTKLSYDYDDDDDD